MQPFRFIRVILTLAAGSLLFYSSPLHAQQKITSALIKQDSTKQFPDTAAVQILPPEPKSGTTAMLLSAVLPGAGQIYAHRYYTIPIIWGLGAYFAYTWNDQNNLYHDYADQFSTSVNLDTIYHQGNSKLKDLRDFYHDQRDEFAIYLALTYILNIVDAYVGATLYSFDVSSDLTPKQTTVKVRIPLR